MAHTNLATLPRPESPEEAMERLRRKSFAIAWVHCGTIRAALKAGFYDERDILKGAALLRDPEVIEIMRREHEHLESLPQPTKASIAAQFASDREFAYSEANPSAAVASTMATAKLYGHMAEDKSVGPKRVTILIAPEIA